jgi:hypothetical protein
LILDCSSDAFETTKFCESTAHGSKQNPAPLPGPSKGDLPVSSHSSKATNCPENGKTLLYATRSLETRNEKKNPPGICPDNSIDCTFNCYLRMLNRPSTHIQDATTDQQNANGKEKIALQKAAL